MESSRCSLEHLHRHQNLSGIIIIGDVLLQEASVAELQPTWSVLLPNTTVE